MDDNFKVPINVDQWIYEEHKDYDNMKKYYMMAIKEGHFKAMTNLGIYYKHQKDYDNMIKYCLMGAEKGDRNAMNVLGIFYSTQKDYDNSLKYLLMAIDKEYSGSIKFLNNIISELPITLLPNLLFYLKYLSQNNINILNKYIDSEFIECIVCYDNEQTCIKYCQCNRNIMCKICYEKWNRCVNCQNNKINLVDC